MVGIEDVILDRLDLTSSYNVPQGSARIQLEAGVNGLVRVIGDVDLNYISYCMNMTTQKPEPSARLRTARVQIEDLGLTAQARRILPPEMTEPDAASAMVRHNLAAMLGGGGPLGAAQQRLVTDAGQMAETLAQGGKRLVLETNITDGPLTLDQALVGNPDALFAALNPRISSAPLALRRAVPRDMLIAATKGELAAEDRLPVGRALITGVGAPRARDRDRDRYLAADILSPLVKEGNVVAALLLAEAFATKNPDLAYRDALVAVASGGTSGLSLLDQLEDNLSFEQVVEIQAIAAPASLRSAERSGLPLCPRCAVQPWGIGALGHITGLSAPRNFETAYY